MKHLVILFVCLGLTAGASATKFTEDFTDISDWTNNGGVVVITDPANSANMVLQVDTDTGEEWLTRGGFNITESNISVKIDVRSYGVDTDYHKSVIALHDGVGTAWEDHIALRTSMQPNSYYDVGYGIGTGFTTIQSANDGGADGNAADTSVFHTIEYVITGLGTVNGNITGYVNGQIADDWMLADWDVDLSAMDSIKQVVFEVKEFTEYDNLKITGLLGGDCNTTGMVSLADLTILATNYGASSATWKMGDFNNDNVVSLADLTILATNYDQSTPIPEPTSMALLGIGAMALLRRRK